MKKKSNIQVNLNFHYHFKDSNSISKKQLKTIDKQYKSVISDLENKINTLNNTNKVDVNSHLPKEFYNKKTLKINCTKRTINLFLEKCHNMYINNDKRHEYSNSNAFKLLIYNIEEYLIEKYGGLVDPELDQKEVLKKNSRKNELIDDFSTEEILTFYYNIEEIYTAKFKRIRVSYYYFENQHLESYSNSLFFQDIINIIDEIELKFYDLNYLNSLNIIRQDNY